MALDETKQCLSIFDLQVKGAKSALGPALDPGPEEGGPGHVPDTGEDWTSFRVVIEKLVVF